MVTFIAERQRDALLWTDITLSTSYNKCHKWTSGWISMHKCRATGCRKYAFTDPRVIVFFFSCCDMYYHLSKYWSLLFLATMNRWIELRKYAFPDPCLLDFFSCLGAYYYLSKYLTPFLTPCIWVLGWVNIKGQWHPNGMSFDDYDGQLYPGMDGA